MSLLPRMGERSEEGSPAILTSPFPRNSLTEVIAGLSREYNNLVRSCDYSMSFDFYVKMYYPRTYTIIQDELLERLEK